MQKITASINNDDKTISILNRSPLIEMAEKIGQPPSPDRILQGPVHTASLDPIQG